MYTETGLIPDIIIRLHRSDGQLLWVEQVHSETFRLDTGALNGPAIIRVPCLFIEDDSRIVIGLPNGHLISYDAHLEDGGKFTGPHTYLCADHGASYISVLLLAMFLPDVLTITYRLIASPNTWSLGGSKASTAR